VQQVPGIRDSRAVDPSDLQQSADDADWAAAIRLRRRGLRLTQRDVAALAGVAERTVIAVEAGSRGVRLGSLLAVLSVLGLRVRIERGSGIVAGDA
jgi:HTH-type transcriptional regulator/antitoxin HipB